MEGEGLCAGVVQAWGAVGDTALSRVEGRVLLPSGSRASVSWDLPGGRHVPEIAVRATLRAERAFLENAAKWHFLRTMISFAPAACDLCYQRTRVWGSLGQGVVSAGRAGAQGGHRRP